MNEVRKQGEIMIPLLSEDFAAFHIENFLTMTDVYCGLYDEEYTTEEAKNPTVFIVMNEPPLENWGVGGNWLAAGFSDMIDGTIARKTGSESTFCVKLDSIADLIFVIVASIKILPSVSFIPLIWIWTGVIAAIKIYIAILVIKRKQEASVHTIY